jgi:hypothetical protein
MRLLERPQLTLGYDGNRREHHRPVLAPLKTQRFPGVALAEGDLATLSDDFDFDVLWERVYCLHAVMLSCDRALRQDVDELASRDAQRQEGSGFQKGRREYRERPPTLHIVDFKPHDLRRWASTNANAVVGNPFWVERYLDHEIGGLAGTYNLHEYAEQKTYVAYAIENKVREAIGKKKIPMPPRPKE